MQFYLLGLSSVLPNVRFIAIHWGVDRCAVSDSTCAIDGASLSLVLPGVYFLLSTTSSTLPVLHLMLPGGQFLIPGMCFMTPGW